MKAFFRWWRDALQGVLPPSVRSALTRPPISAIVLVRREGCELRPWHGRRAGDVPLASSLTEMTVRLARIPRPLRAFRMLEVRVAERDCVILENLLPASARHRAREILRMEQHRVGLLDDSRVYAACHVEPVAGDRRRVRARLYLVKRALVDPVLDELAVLRFPIHAVTVETADGEALPLDLLPAEKRRKLPAGLSGWLNRALMALATIVIITALFVAGMQGWWLWKANQQLDAMIASSMQQARAVMGKSAQLQRHVELATLLRTRKNTRPILVAIIDELSRILPSSAYVERLALNGNEVRLTGHATSASALVRALSASPMFDKVSFISPVRMDQAGGKEHFALRIQLASKK